MQEKGSGSVAAAYIGLKYGGGKELGSRYRYDIIHASVNALLSAYNNMEA